jgi:hypothetical protein
MRTNGPPDALLFHGNDAEPDDSFRPGDRVLTADAAFREAANAAAAAWQRQPPYIAYRVDVDVNVPALNENRRISRAVTTRTDKDLAVLQDLPRGQNQLGQSFPLIPTFDALSYFHLNFRLGDPIRRHNPLSGVVMDAPLTFSAPQPSREDVAVVVTTLRNYYAVYADDSTEQRAHIRMDPLPALTRNNTSTFYLHDVYVDTSTHLPTRVTYRGPDADFDVDYTTIGDRWLVNHVYYRRTMNGPLRLGRVSFTVDAHYADFSFPETPTDPRLR